MLLQDTSALQPLADTAKNTINALQTTSEQQLSLFELLTKGGWVMIPLTILALLGLIIFFERYLTIRKASKNESQLTSQVKSSIKSGKTSLVTLTIYQKNGIGGCKRTQCY